MRLGVISDARMGRVRSGGLWNFLYPEVDGEQRFRHSDAYFMYHFPRHHYEILLWWSVSIFTETLQSVQNRPK